jgi:hypothetical protein
MPCFRGGGWRRRSTPFPWHHRQGGGHPDPCRRGSGHQLAPLAAARSEVDGSRCWGGHNLARGGAIAVPARSTMLSTAWAPRHPTCGLSERERTGKSGEGGREEMAAPAIFWMSPSSSPVDEPFLCTFFWGETVGGSRARNFPTRSTSSLAQLAHALMRETSAGAAVGGVGHTLLWEKEGAVGRILLCCSV